MKNIILPYFIYFVTATSLFAQIPSNVPSEYSDLYGVMQTNLTNYAQTVSSGWNGQKSNMDFCAELYPATSLGGSKTPSQEFFNESIIPYLNGLQKLGVTEIKFSINFPCMYQPYYNSAQGANNPSAYQGTLNFYKQIVAAIRQRGLKVVIPTQVVFPFEYTQAETYLGTLTLQQYIQGRSQLAQTIAQELQPDYLFVQNEPITEVGNVPAALSSQLTNMTTDMQMVSTILTDLNQAGLSTNRFVGAGMGTWQPDFEEYLSALENLPMNAMDVHVYPINDVSASQNYLPRILEMADGAHAHNMHICMTECWINKEQNSELSDNGYNAIVPSRSVYSFWIPLDEEFLYLMTATGYWKDFDLINPFYTQYFFAYLDYNQMQPVIAGQTPDQAAATLSTYANSATTQALADGQTTETGQYYASLANVSHQQAFDNAYNTAWLNAFYNAQANAKANAWDNAYVAAYNLAHNTAFDNAYDIAWEYAFQNAKGNLKYQAEQTAEFEAEQVAKQRVHDLAHQEAYFGN